MAYIEHPEKPNTVSGLQAKRKELIKLRYQYQAEVKKLTVDIDHVDAAIKLFSPEAANRALPTRLIEHRAQKGEVKAFVLSMLREADEPLTSKHITDAWLADRGLVADSATAVTMRKRIGACLNTCKHQGLIESAGLTSDHDVNGPYKLWIISENS